MRHRLFIALLLLLATFVFLLTTQLRPSTLREIVRTYRTLVTIFLGIFVGALPFLLLGTLASGLVEEFVSRDALDRLTPHNRLGGALTGALMGLAFPLRERGEVPLARRLFRKGLPLSVVATFLLGAHVINPVVIVSTYAAFGWGPVLLGRIGFTLLIAMAVGLIFGRAPHPVQLLQLSARPVAKGSAEELASSGSKSSREEKQRLGPSARMARALATAGDEFFETGRFLVLGSLLAAGMQTMVPQSSLLAIGNGALSSVVAMLGLAFVLSVCSTADAFVALAFVNTFTTGSILGFLVFGAMADIKSVRMFLGIFRRRVALYLVLLPLMMSLLIAVYLNLNTGW